jgi:hypothetical protein
MAVIYQNDSPLLVIPEILAGIQINNEQVTINNWTMAITYKNETTVSGLTSNGVFFHSLTGSDVVRVAFNNPPVTLAGNHVVCTFETGVSVTPAASGTVYINRAYNGQNFYFIRRNRQSFVGTFLSASNTMTLSSNGDSAWGPTEQRLRALEQF